MDEPEVYKLKIRSGGEDLCIFEIMQAFRTDGSCEHLVQDALVSYARGDERKGVCVYCGEITEYESTEQKQSATGNEMRIAHIRQCAHRPELKLIAEVERLMAANIELAKFAEHAPHCDSNTRYPSPPCDCGLNLALLGQ